MTVIWHNSLGYICEVSIPHHTFFANPEVIAVLYRKRTSRGYVKTEGKPETNWWYFREISK
jgi:hypothetical protein